MTFQERLSSLFPNPRTEPWRRLLELGFPEKEKGIYQYVRLADLYKAPLVRSLDSIKGTYEKQANTLLFLNGRYIPAFSHVPEGVIALPLSEAYLTYGNFIKPRSQSQIQEEKDPFALLNASLHEDGLFLYIPPKTVVKEPLRIMHVVDSPLVLALARIHFFAGKQASCDLFIDQRVCMESACLNGYFDFALEERSEVRIAFVAESAASSWRFDHIKATLKKESRLTTYSVAGGAKISREDYAIRLWGEGAEANLNGIWKLKDSRQHHVFVTMNHEKPFCHSLQTFKGVLYDVAKSSFVGKIAVSQVAQKTEAFQMNHNLVLGNLAQANSKPNLEILADDVKASHGATVGKLKEEDLFYLKTRGLPKELAATLLVDGFLGEVIEKIPIRAALEKARKIAS